MPLILTEHDTLRFDCDEGECTVTLAFYRHEDIEALTSLIIAHYRRDHPDQLEETKTGAQMVFNY